MPDHAWSFAPRSADAASHEASDDQRCGHAKGPVHYAASMQSYMLRIVMTIDVLKVPTQGTDQGTD